MNSFILWGLRFWVIFAFARVLIHGIKNAFLIPRLGNRRAHLVSSFVMITIVVLFTYLLLGIPEARATVRELIIIGTLWAGLSFILDILVLRCIFGEEMSYILYNYKLHRGRLHSLVLLVMFISPLVFGYLLK